MTPERIVIAGGGTGGHLYPGIAVARELRRRVPEMTVSFAGTARGIESRVVPREGFDQIVAMAIVDPTAGGNPIPLTKELAAEMLTRCFEGVS